jgi:hypothetical protein
MGNYVDIAISLMLVFLMLSLIVTAINEVLSTLLKERPKMLLRTIKALLDDQDVYKSFYKHGLFISAKTASAGDSDEIHTRDHPSYFASVNFARALTVATLRAQNGWDTSKLFVFDDVKGAVQKLGESRIKDVLVAALSNAQGQVEGFEREVAAWFDTTQDRLTGEYARRQKWIAMGVGAALVCTLNVDAVQISRTLQSNDVVRAGMVETATEVVKERIAAECEAVAGAAPGQSAAECLLKSAQTNLSRIDPALLGWSDDPLMAGAGVTFSGAISKALGLTLTVFAISLGAPFWFDLLSSFVNIRGAGRKPERTDPATPPVAAPAA